MRRRAWLAPVRGLVAASLLAALPLAETGPARAQGAADAPSLPANVTPAERDAWLRGYVESWLLHVHRIGPDHVRVEVRRGVVTLTGFVASPERIDHLVGTVASFAPVAQVVNRLQVGEPPQGERAAGAEGQAGRWQTWLPWLRAPLGRKRVLFPMGDLFAAPLADQKQPRFHTTYQRYHLGFGTFDVASVGFGENFGIVRFPREREGDGWQLGISGAVFAIFNLDAPSSDLIDADYIVGFPLSYRSGAWSARLRLYHQSSHLGDEFLLEPQPGPPVERINLSYEALETLASYEKRGMRVYGGGTRIFASETSLGRDRMQAGVEYRGAPIGWRTARLVGALDVQAWDETSWDRDKSFKAGLQFRSPYGDARSLQVLFEYYEGHAPHGQFFTRVVEYFGLGVAYAF